MAKTKNTDNQLGAYLGELNDRFPDVNYERCILARTNIDSTELYKLKNNIITRFSAEKFYQVHLAVERPIEEVIDKIYPNLKLPIKTLKEFTKERSDLGNILFGKFSLEEIEYKTEIKKTRLKDILTNNDIIILASELILIELATDRKKGQLFKQMFKKVKLKPTKK